MKSGSVGPPTSYIFKVVLDIKGPLQFHMNFKISLSFSIKKEARSAGFNAYLLKEVFADRMTINSSENFAPIWSLGVKLMRIWDCLILLDIGATGLRAEGARESIKSGANLSLNKLQVPDLLFKCHMTSDKLLTLCALIYNL